MLVDSYGYTPVYFISTDAGKIVAALPLMEIESFFSSKRAVSLPFSDYCGPLLSKEADIKTLLDEVIKYGKKRHWKHLEIRSIQEIPEEAAPCGVYFHHELELLKDEGKMFSRFDASNRRNIRKGIKEGLEVKFDTSLESVKAYYDLHCGTRKLHGLPPQPYSFFRNIQKYILSQGNGIVSLALHHGNIIAGAIFMHFGNKVMFKFGASNREYQKFRPNNVLMWKTIEMYASNGYKVMSFGRTDIENVGLRKYKLLWGTREEKVSVIKYDYIKNGFEMYRRMTYGFHNNIFRVLPIPISRLAGEMMYRYMD